MRAMIDLNRIITGDALDALDALPSSSFAVCVTSPPYNLGWSNPASKAGKGGVAAPGRYRGEYAGFDDRLPDSDYVEYHRAVVAQLLRVLQPDGLLWYVHQRKGQSEPTGCPALVDLVLGGYPVRKEIIWDKGRPGAGFCAAGRTGGAFYPTPSYETIFLLAKDRSALLDRHIAAQGDVWRFPRPRNTGHPAAFPLALVSECLDATLASGPVLDPFLGSGTTALAAMQKGRDWLGIEQAPEYVELAQEQLAKED